MDSGWAAKLMDAVTMKRSESLFAVAAIASGLVLFLPASALERLYLHGLRTTHGQWLGLAFIGSVAVLVVAGAVKLAKLVSRWRSRTATKRRVSEKLASLDEGEKGVIREFFLRERSALTLPVDHAAVAALLRVGILEPVSPSVEATVFARLGVLRLTEEAANVVTAAHIDWPDRVPSREAVRSLSARRPEFVDRIDSYEALKHGHAGW